MQVLGVIIELFLWFYILLILTRLVADWVQMLARSWQPSGPMLILLEVVYSFTDPPIRLIKRIVPTIRFGGVALDLSLLIVLLVCWILQVINRNTLLIA